MKARAHRSGGGGGKGGYWRAGTKEKNQLLLWRRQAEKNWDCVVGGGRREGSVYVRGGALSVSLETVLRPLHLHRTVHDKLREAGGQEVQTEHHSDKVRH